MSISKKFLKSKPVCKVTFKLPKELADGAEHVKVLGDFNAWNKEDASPMKSLKTGGFTATVDLEAGREFQFRYLINDAVWTNDDSADKYVSSPFADAQNSVVVTA